MIGNAAAKPALIFALSLTMSLAACLGRTIGLVQNSEAKSASGLRVKVIEESQPGTVNIYKQTDKAEVPPANQKWIVLSTEMTPPRGGASLPAREIKLVDGANVYAALAMASGSEETPAFVYFTNPNGLIQMSASGNPLWSIDKNGTTGEKEIKFPNADVKKVYLLFAVPTAAKNLSLQLS